MRIGISEDASIKIAHMWKDMMLPKVFDRLELLTYFDAREFATATIT
jgi:hypothetical protein